MMPMDKKTFMAAIAISVLIFSLVGVQSVKLSEANFHFSGPDIVIKSPANGATYNSSDVFVDLMILTDGTNFYSPTFAICRLDWGSFINVTLLNPRNNNQWFGEGTFYDVSQASHTLNVEVHIVSRWFPGQEGKTNANSTFTVGLSTPDTSTPTVAPPPTPLLTPSPVQSASDYWTTKTPLPYPLTELPYGQRAAVLDGKIYALTSGPKLEIYNPVLDTWTEKGAPPYLGSLVACQGRIYLIGGDSYYQSCSVYYPGNDSWTAIAAIPTGRYDIQPQEVNGKIYVVGGGRVRGLFMFEIFSENEVYDPTTDSWSEMARIPQAVCNYASAVVDGKIYVIGGMANFSYVGGDRMQQTYTNMVQIYDPQSNQWTTGTPMSTPASYVGGASTSGALAPVRIYAVGGNIDGHKTGDANYSTVNWTRIYDPKTASWSTGAPLPTARWGLSLVNVEDKLYSLGGGTADNVDDHLLVVNEEYIPSDYLFPTSSPTTSSPALSPSPSVPEFPTWTVLPLATATILGVLVYSKWRRAAGA
jgi:N-acetylneuraminic acid mutarotase